MINRPYKLGLTGSIGMGKSTTANLFRELGIPVWDADAAVAALYEKEGAAVPLISAVLPDAIRDGAVDRAALKNKIAVDPEVLRTLEKIVHPLVQADRKAFAKVNSTAPILIFDIPLLFETNGDAEMDGVLVVTTSPDEQRRRVLDRGQMTEAEFEIILSRQLPDLEKRARADYVLETNSIDQTRADVVALIKKLEAKNA
ncbi:dephospho-CoA kinase [Litoreibacter roseus]|uniref:Dephospho-CoA kinase n=1 Tax=Litoreibacter roseus TaxID=2601869 RepID=A0A6N6JGN2_9RHOB|nr:dephospho-CoA kinase [Litoreibacter roseus]GFE64549.1 dephospho-CoA kinase [Litoreibacter roseus]